ncbi:MAG: DUF3606 domain-containing protein [Burkholderiales bacterium]
MLVDKNRTPTDTSRVNLAEEWEVHWWCDRFGCTEVALRTAVDKVGPSADSVERQLKEAAKAAFKNTGED